MFANISDNLYCRELVRGYYVKSYSCLRHIKCIMRILPFLSIPILSELKTTWMYRFEFNKDLIKESH